MKKKSGDVFHQIIAAVTRCGPTAVSLMLPVIVYNLRDSDFEAVMGDMELDPTSLDPQMQYSIRTLMLVQKWRDEIVAHLATKPLE